MDQSITCGSRSMIKDTLKSGRKGQELVEFAIIFPLLMLVVFGVLDLGRIFFASISIANVAREGARYGINYWCDRDEFDVKCFFNSSEIIDAALIEAENRLLDPTIISVIPEGDACNNVLPQDVVGQPITVTVAYQFDLIFGGIINLDSIVLERSAVMLIP